jgi:hypothetical protein
MILNNLPPCSLGLSATSQQYFSLTKHMNALRYVQLHPTRKDPQLALMKPEFKHCHVIKLHVTRQDIPVVSAKALCMHMTLQENHRLVIPKKGHFSSLTATNVARCYGNLKDQTGDQITRTKPPDHPM